VQLRAVGAFETAAYEAALKNHVERLKLDRFVHWTGFTQDVEAELQKMDLFVLPSLFGDGLPIVLLEAMSAGVPIVATRVQGIPEVIRDGVDGVIATPGSAHELTRAIGRFLEGDVSWAALRNNALSRQAELFSDRSMAAGVAAAYRRVAQMSRIKLPRRG
jgi:glycosyltransferase involved in cell wall biosynthesis